VDWLSSLVSGKIFSLPAVFLADLAVDSGDSVRVSPVFGLIWSCGREEALPVAFCVEISRAFVRIPGAETRFLCFCPSSPPVWMCFVP
jgi:hypothetical protein